jgi:hypothetical protein
MNLQPYITMFGRRVTNESEYFANLACTRKTSDLTNWAMLLQNVGNSFYKFGSLN